MKKIVMVGMCIICMNAAVFAREDNFKPVNNVIQAGISMTDRVPDGYFGSWKVVSVLSKTNSLEEFAKYSVDIWNLSKSGDVITLSNPVSGATASVTVNDVKGDMVKFEKRTIDADEESIETPILTLESNDNFSGTDKIVINTYNKNGQLVKTEFIEYKVKAYKISGDTIPNLFGR